MKKYLLLLLSFFSICISCEKEDINTSDNDNNNSSDCPTNIYTGDDQIKYSGSYQDEVRSILSKAKPWQTNSCISESDGVPPAFHKTSNGYECIRDSYVDAALQYAWAAESYYRLGETDKASEMAGLAKEQLNQADALCSTIPVVGPGVECQTLEIWPCDNGNSNTGDGSIICTNNAPTTVNITLNGVSKSISPSSTVSYSGTAGSSASGTATTSGTVGSTYSWNINTSFPSSGNVSVVLNVGSDYFFLKLKNTSNESYNKLYVNYNTTDQTIHNISLPNNGTTYSAGYFKAFTNTLIKLENGNIGTNPVNASLSFTSNQVATVWIQ